jgi:hypothetical protein
MESHGGANSRSFCREQYGDYWIAYVKHHKKLYKKYLGPTDKLTMPRLEEVAEELTKQMENASDLRYQKGLQPHLHQNPNRRKVILSC